MRKGMKVFVNGRFVVSDIVFGPTAPQDILVAVLANLHPVAGAFRLKQLRSFVRRVHKHNSRFCFPAVRGVWRQQTTGSLRGLVDELKTAGLLNEFSDSRLSTSRSGRRRFAELLIERKVFPGAEELAITLARTFERSLMNARIIEHAPARKRTKCGCAA